MSGPAPLLEVVGLTGGRGRADVLHGVDLTLRPAEATGLLGPNGAGKTTLLRMIAGLDRPRSGRVRFDGRDVTDRPAHDRVVRGLVLVPHDRLLFDGLSVRENLAAGALFRRDRAAVDRDAEAMMDRFPRLAERAGQPAGTLSGGEQRMLAVARALMARPRLLLLDEPSLGLAPAVARAVFALVRGIAASGTGVLVVEQTAEAALAVADRLAVLDRGRVVRGGPAGAAAPAGLPAGAGP